MNENSARKRSKSFPRGFAGRLATIITSGIPSGITLAVALGITAVALLTLHCVSEASILPTRTHAFIAPLAADKGTFKILVSGQQIGKEEFSIAPNGGDWSAHGSTEIQSPKGNTHVIGTLLVHPDGVPVHYEWSTQGAKKASAAIAFSGVTASVELHLEGARPFTQQFTFAAPLVVVLDDNLYYQYTFLARLYDWDKKGEQTFAVLVPQEMTPGTVTVDSMGEQVVNGQKVQELRVKTEDNEIDLFLDGPKLVRLVAPAANAEIIRE
ncbi:MAG: hypothetical protein WA804_23175 [Terriglobales bacterium]|jgi:hypothetical protein